MAIFQNKNGLNYAELVAVEIIKNRTTLKEQEGILKSRHGGWHTFYAVRRALRRMQR